MCFFNENICVLACLFYVPHVDVFNLKYMDLWVLYNSLYTSVLHNMNCKWREPHYNEMKGFSVIFASYIWYKSCLNQRRSSSDLDSCFVQAKIQWMLLGSIEWNCGILTLAQSDPVVSRYCCINSLPKSWDTSWDPICDFKYYSLAKSYSKLLVTKLG